MEGRQLKRNQQFDEMSKLLEKVKEGDKLLQEELDYANKQYDRLWTLHCKKDDLIRKMLNYCEEFSTPFPDHFYNEFDELELLK